jgi:ABC-type sugar transport system permease subunit
MKPAASSRGALWALPAALFLAALVAWPVLQLVRVSFCRGGGQSGFGIGRRLYEPGTWTDANYTALLHETYFWELLGFTVWLGFVVTAICLVLGSRPPSRRSRK